MIKWWNNGNQNKRSINSPGIEWKLGRIKFKRSSPSDETKQKISKSSLGRIAWNKGLKTGPETEEIKKKKSISAKSNKNAKGNVPWNKGVSADTDIRILNYTKKQKGQKRNGNYKKGENHPFYNSKLKEFKRYRLQVINESEKIYLKYKDIINPNNYTRTLAGVEGGYHLDHIISVKYGFNNNISIKKIACLNNLQMLPWKENVIKSDN